MKPSLVALALALVAGTPQSMAAQLQKANFAARDSQRVLVLENGANAIDLLGDRTRAQVFVAWRSNNNAHGSSTVTFDLFAKSDVGSAGGLWQVVPFFGGPHDPETGRESFRTTEGADCTLADLRVVQHAGAPAEVVIGNRALGKSFADPAPVRFDYYGLVKNGEGQPGWPTFYFKHLRTVSAKRSYCDVNEAFAKELGLGAIGLGHGEGGR